MHADRVASTLHAASLALQQQLKSVLRGIAIFIASSTVFFASLLGQHPWLRSVRNAMCHLCAFLVGSSFEDERVVFSKPTLVKNDSHRDRLLEPEIADFVDFMRRAGVTRAELLRYCDLRVMPLTSFLLPESQDSMAHRSGMTQRWDILQWVAACFSVCTLELDMLMQMSIDEACRRAMPEDSSSEQLVDSQGDELQEGQQSQRSSEHIDMELKPNLTVELGICDQVSRCSEFFLGVLNSHEFQLQALLHEFYREDGETTRRDQQPAAHRAALPGAVVNVLTGKSVRELAVPQLKSSACVSVRVGAKSASAAHPQPEHMAGVAKSPSGVDTVVNGSTLKVREFAKEAPVLHGLSSLSNTDDAWKVTANHTMASVCVDITLSEQSQSGNSDRPATSMKNAWQLFSSITSEISDGKLDPEKCEALRKKLVSAYGYQFTKFLFAKSSLQQVSAASKSSSEEKRAQQRYAKSWESLKIPENKPSYW